MALAASHGILLVSMAFCVGAVTSIANYEKGVIRREAYDNKRVHLDQASRIEVMSVSRGGTVQHQPDTALFRSAGKVYTIPMTNRQYLKMTTDGSDECEGSPPADEIREKAECETAAQKLGLDVGENLTINNYNAVDTGGVLLVVKKCFLNTTTNKVHFNPTEANASRGQKLQGTKICWRPLYHMAVAAEGQTDDLCADDAKKITSLQDCIQAMTDAVDGNACRLPEFKKDEAINDPSKPIGCWRDGIGCWSYNSGSSFAGGTNMTQVCKCSSPS